MAPKGTPLALSLGIALALAGCGGGLYTAEGLPPLNSGGNTCVAPQRLCSQGCFLPSALEACGSSCAVCSTSVPGARATCDATGGGDYACGIECPAGQLRTGSTCALPSAIAGGDGHTCAVAGGLLKCWGDNASGQVKPGSPATVLVPVDVASSVGAVAAGPTHTCAAVGIGAGQAVQCWGSGGGIAQLPTPAPTNVRAVAAGASHTCALHLDGTVTCWGTGPATAVPPGLTGAQAITSGANHVCVETAANTVTCWGDNSLGQLGNGTASGSGTNANVVADVTFVAAGRNHTCAATSATTQMFCWGSNPAAGDGTTVLPTLANPQTTPLPPRRTGGGGGAELVRAAILAPMAAGRGHTCFVLDVDGVACFGQDEQGQLSAAWIGELVKQGVGTVGVRVLGAGADHSCAVYSDGMKCWGANGKGQLGGGTQGAVAVGTLVPVSGK